MFVTPPYDEALTVPLTTREAMMVEATYSLACHMAELLTGMADRMIEPHELRDRAARCAEVAQCVQHLASTASYQLNLIITPW